MPVKQGALVVLGPLLPADGPELFRWMNDPAIAASNGCWRPTDGMDFGVWFQNLGKDPSRVTFALRPPGAARLMGYLSIMSIHPVFRSAEMGVTIAAPEDRGHGLGREAVALGLGYCWDNLALERVSLRIYGDNPAALRCYQAAGFMLEGVQRKAAFLDGRWMDVTLMGVLRARSSAEGGGGPGRPSPQPSPS